MPAYAIACYTALFTLLAYCDLKYRRIPNLLILVGFFFGLFIFWDNIVPHIVGLLVGIGIPGCAYSVSRATGLGDIYLCGLAGWVVGFPFIALALIVALGLTLIVLLIRLRREASRKITFGPYMAFGVFIVLAAIFLGGVR